MAKIANVWGDRMRAYTKIMDILAILEKFCLIVTGMGTTILTFINVVVRKFTNFQFAWTEELVVNFFVLMIMCGVALSAREGGLISLSLIYDALSAKGKKIYTAISSIICIVFYIVVIKTGFDKIATQMANGKRTPTLLWPEWVFMIFLPIGCILLVLHTVEYCMNRFSNKNEVPETEKELKGEES